MEIAKMNGLRVIDTMPINKIQPDAHGKGYSVKRPNNLKLEVTLKITDVSDLKNPFSVFENMPVTPDGYLQLIDPTIDLMEQV